MEGVAGGAEEGGAVVENDAQRDVLHEFAEASFVEEGFQEHWLLEERKDFCGDAAADKDTAGGHGLESEVTGFGAEDGDEDVQGLLADGAGFVQGGTGDDGAGVLVGEGGGDRGRLGAASGRDEKAVDVG